MKGIRIFIGVALVIAVFAARAGNISPSFDCTKATLATEKAICRSPTLSAADRRVAQAYKTAVHMVQLHWQLKFKSLAEGEAVIHQGQRSWLKERNRCRDIADCLQDEMTTRTKDLEGLTMQLFYGANPEAFVKPIELDEKHPQKVDFFGDGTGVEIGRSYLRAKEDRDDGAFILKLGNAARGYTEIDVPILSYSIPQSNDPDSTYPEMFIWTSGKQQGMSKSNVVLEQDAQVSKSLQAILGVPGTLIGVDIYEDTGCPRSCSADYLYLFFIDHNLHVTPLLAAPWGYYDGSSAWGNTDVASKNLTLFTGNDAIKGVYLRFETTLKDFWIDQDHPCQPSQSTKTIVYYYSMDKADPAFKVQQGDPAALESDGDITDVDTIKVKYTPPTKSNSD